MTLPQIESLGHYIDGSWVEDEPVFASTSPAFPEHVIGHFPSGATHVDAVVDAARRAQRSWRTRPLDDRIRALETLSLAFADAAESIAQLVTAEMGKPIMEARGEARALSGKVAVTAHAARRDLEPLRPEGVSGYATWRPLGVMAVIGPFNFPVHLSNGHIMPALMAGNAVILKPSETTPACAQRYVEIWDKVAREVGIPRALLQLVQGAGDVGAALAEHPGVNAVAFTGSYAVGVKIRQACAHQTGKLVALELGGKNTAIVMRDADVQATAAIIAQAAFATTGQRCTATSRVVVHSGVSDALVEALAEHCRQWSPGNPFEDSTRMGPLATERARDHFVSAQGNLTGLNTIVAGGRADAPEGTSTDGYWVKPALHQVSDVDAAGERLIEELFGPEILVEAVSDDASLVQRANATPYGLAMSVHSTSQARFEAIRDELEAGIVNWNAPTAGASGALPFGGLKHSGNHRPAGATAIRYCVAPVATLLG